MRPTRHCAGDDPSRQDRLRAIIANGLERRRRRRRRRLAVSTVVAVVVAATATRAFDADTVHSVRIDTAAPHSGEQGPLGAVPLTDTPATAAVDIAQQFATALADEDWARARQLSPALPNFPVDLSLAYGAIEEYEIVPIDATVTLPLVTLRIATITHVGTDVPGSRWTLANCATWEIDLSTNTLRELQIDNHDVQGAIVSRANEWPAYEGWINLESLTDDARLRCQVDDSANEPYE